MTTGTAPDRNAPFGWVSEGHQTLDLKAGGAEVEVLTAEYPTGSVAPVSGATANATFTNQDDTVVSVSQEPAPRKYALKVDPVKTGTTELRVTSNNGNVGVLVINVT